MVAFNAALVLYSSLLIYHDAEYRGMPFAPGDIDTRREHIQKAIECLHQLDRGNRMADKCAEYTARLARILDSLCELRSSSILSSVCLTCSPIQC